MIMQVWAQLFKASHKSSHILSAKKFFGVLEIFNVLNFNDTLTNDVVSFEQPGPDLIKVVNIYSLLRLYGSVQLFLHIPYDPTKHIYMLRKYFIKKTNKKNNR